MINPCLELLRQYEEPIKLSLISLLPLVNLTTFSSKCVWSFNVVSLEWYWGAMAVPKQQGELWSWFYEDDTKPNHAHSAQPQHTTLSEVCDTPVKEWCSFGRGVCGVRFYLDTTAPPLMITPYPHLTHFWPLTDSACTFTCSGSWSRCHPWRWYTTVCHSNTASGVRTRTVETH